ncbi:MAG: hypothetical protein EP329_07770 [Deltaproteobacteria bacterium]|nr:MAG: hypothetical protein EP329_07770 [Deltaproteobacteria bacterium]
MHGDANARTSLDVRDLEVEADSPAEVFAQVASLFEGDAGEIAAALSEREEHGSTDLDADVAIPHADVEGLDRGVLVDVRLHRAVRWGQRLVRRCFCVVTPPGSNEEHANLLAEAARRALGPGTP